MIKQNEDRCLILANKSEKQEERATMSIDIYPPNNVCQSRLSTSSFREAEPEDPHDVLQEAKNVIPEREEEESNEDLLESMEMNELESSDPRILEKLSHLPGRVQAEIVEAVKHLRMTAWSLCELKQSDVLALYEFCPENETPISSRVTRIPAEHERVVREEIEKDACCWDNYTFLLGLVFSRRYGNEQ